MMLDLYKILILSIAMKKTVASGVCGANFANATSSGLCFGITGLMSFTQALAHCYLQGGHLASFFEVHEAVWEEPDRYHMAIHNLFSLGTGNLWFDLKHGVLQPARYFNHIIPVVILNQSARKETILNYLQESLRTTFMNSTAKAVCAKDLNLAVYDRKASISRVNSFRLNHWPIGVPPNNFYDPRSKAPGSISSVNSYVVCLGKCLKNPACSSVYYSLSKKICIQRLYIDAPINSIENALSDDFNRYSLEKTFPSLPSWADDPVPYSYTVKINNSNSYNGSGSLSYSSVPTSSNSIQYSPQSPQSNYNNIMVG